MYSVCCINNKLRHYDLEREGPSQDSIEYDYDYFCVRSLRFPLTVLLFFVLFLFTNFLVCLYLIF